MRNLKGRSKADIVMQKTRCTQDAGGMRLQQEEEVREGVGGEEGEEGGVMEGVDGGEGLGWGGWAGVGVGEVVVRGPPFLGEGGPEGGGWWGGFGGGEGG